MNDIKVGEYCRTGEGYIMKCIRIHGDIIEFKNYIDQAQVVYDDEKNEIVLMDFERGYEIDVIKSHSKNIIDLIEEGDYVNGSEVINITELKRMDHNLPIAKVIEIERDYGMMEEYEPTQVLENEIESIVTKEQFDSMKYVLGGKEE